MPKLPNQPRAMITGAASGFGRELALQLAKRGARILVADVHEERMAETVGLIEQAGGQAHALFCDVTDAT